MINAQVKALFDLPFRPKEMLFDNYGFFIKGHVEDNGRVYLVVIENPTNNGAYGAAGVRGSWTVNMCKTGLMTMRRLQSDSSISFKYLITGPDGHIIHNGLLDQDLFSSL